MKGPPQTSIQAAAAAVAPKAQAEGCCSCMQAVIKLDHMRRVCSTTGSVPSSECHETQLLGAAGCTCNTTNSELASKHPHPHTQSYATAAHKTSEQHQLQVQLMEGLCCAVPYYAADRGLEAALAEHLLCINAGNIRVRTNEMHTENLALQPAWQALREKCNVCVICVNAASQVTHTHTLSSQAHARLCHMQHRPQCQQDPCPLIWAMTLTARVV